MTDNRSRGSGSPSTSVSSKDAFWLTDLYPNAAELFSNAPAPIAEAKDKAFVALDANVLLWPYEFNSASLAEMDRVYKDLSDSNRLVVPAQAAREFYKHRSRKIAALSENIEGAIERARKPMIQQTIPLLEDDPDYKKAQELNRTAIKSAKEIISLLQTVKQKLKTDIATDPVSTVYRNRLTASVVELVNMDREALLTEVERRGRLRIAPGFKDQNKDDLGVGDFIIWKTILQVAKERRIDCLFVTNEEKSDWWIRSGGAFHPRPELLDEYRRASEGCTIHLLPLSELLSLFSAGDDVVQGVQNLEEASRNRYDDDTIASEVDTVEFWANILKQRNQYETRIKQLATELFRIEANINELDRQADDESDPHTLEKILFTQNALRYDAHALRSRLAAENSAIAALPKIADLGLAPDEMSSQIRHSIWLANERSMKE